MSYVTNDIGECKTNHSLGYVRENTYVEKIDLK